MSLTDWQDYAACRGHDPELFFKQSAGIAKAICAACPVLARCRTWTDRVEEFGTDPSHFAGTYAGENSRERAQRRIRKQLEAVA